MTESGVDIPHPQRSQDFALHSNPETPIQHFVPLETPEGTTPRDRFGNRIFSSANKSYFDRQGHETKAAMLVSSNGEAFIKKNPGILNDIDRGINELTYALKPDSLWKTIEEIDLGRERKMKKLPNGQGGQSLVYLLEVGDEKYVVKKKVSQRRESESVSQPYINEMLQTQAIEHDLQRELHEAGIEMPTYQFASGQVSCAEFVEGLYPSEEYLHKKIADLLPKIESYISGQEAPLWKNIQLDAKYTDVAPRTIMYKTDNFIQKKDRTIVWIDPFLYDPTPKSQKLIIDLDPDTIRQLLGKIK